MEEKTPEAPVSVPEPPVSVPEPPEDTPSRPEKASGMALASLILSLLGFFCTLTAVVGLILGIIELGRIRRGDHSEKGKGMAIAGVILGALVVTVISIILIVSLIRGNFSFEFESSS